MHGVIYNISLTLFVELIVLVFIQSCKYIVNKIGLKRINYDLSGYWKNFHNNPMHEDIYEIIKIKQLQNEIKLTIKQYKKDSYKKYHGSGVISGENVMMYYCGSDQVGVFAFAIQDDYHGNRVLNGEYIEGADLNTKSQTRKRNIYTLERMKIKFIDRIILSFNKKYEYAEKLLSK